MRGFAALPVIIVLVAASLIGIGLYKFSTYQHPKSNTENTTANDSTKPYYPDSQGWNRKALKNDEFQSFFPLTLKTSQRDLYLIGPNTQGVFKNTEPTVLETAGIEYRDNISINLSTTQEKPTPVKILTSRRTFYALPKMLVFKIWLEQVPQEEFSTYKEAVTRELDNYKAEANVEKLTYKNHEYYLYFRKDLTKENLKDKNSIGGAYIYFPEKNTAVFISIFNPASDSVDPYMLNHQDAISAINQIIDSVTK